MLSTIQAEQAVAGSVLCDTKARFWPEARGFLRAEDFTDENCKAVFVAACKLYDEGKAADAVTVSRAAGIDNRLAAELLEVTPTAANVTEYAKMVHAGALCRSLAEIGQALTEQAISNRIDPLEAATDAAAKLDALTSEGSGHDLLSAGDVAEQFLEGRAEQTGKMLRSFPSVDKYIGGLAPDRLYIMAARPGIGKSALGISMAALLAKKFRVLYVSLEMSGTEIAARVISSYSGVVYSRLLNGAALTEAEERAVAEAAQRFDGLHLFINKAATASVAQIGVWAREVEAEVCFVDHIGLLRGEATQSEYERTTAISGNLKRLARTLHIPIVAECQLNRSTVATSGNDNRPRLHQLRSSGALEQDCDCCFLLHREDAYRAETERAKPNEPQIFEVEIAKNRHGRTGCVALTWFAANNRFVDENRGAKHSWHLNSWQ